MMPPRTLQLVHVTEKQAKALTAIARHGTNRRFTPQFNAGADMMQEVPWHLSMRPVASDDGAGDMSRCVSLDWHGATFFLRLSSDFCGQWLAARLPHLQIDALPAPFIEAAWEAMIAEALRELGLELLCGGIRIMPDGSRRAHSERQYTWMVSIRPVDAARTIHAELSVDDTGLPHLAELVRRLPASDSGCSDMLLGKLPVRVRARVGMTTLEAADLRALEVGDAVLFDRCLTTAAGDIYLATPDGQGARVRACEKGGSRYVVTEEWNLLMNDFADESPDEADDAAFGREHGAQRGQTFESGRDDALDIPFGDEHGARFTGEFDTAPSAGSKDHDGCSPAHGAVESVAREATSPNGLNVDRIPVRLSFDLGEQMLTLGELRRLQPGEYVDLQRRLDAGPVHIRANGSLIGTAELVDIEGRIGARVLTLTLDRGSCF